MRVHTVLEGDSLSKIAAEYYGVGDMVHVDKIFAANPDNPAMPDVDTLHWEWPLGSGKPVVLTIPD